MLQGKMQQLRAPCALGRCHTRRLQPSCTTHASVQHNQTTTDTFQLQNASQASPQLPRLQSTQQSTASLAHLQQQLQRQHLLEQQPYVPATDAAGRAKQLTCDISHKQHWSQLQHCWLDNAGDFSPIHYTAAVCKLARLAVRDGFTAADRPEVFQFSSALLSAVSQQIPQLDSRGLAQCLWAYAKLQSAAPHSSSSGDAAAAALASTLLQQGHFQHLQPSQLSQAAWAGATLQGMGMTLTTGWWSAVQQRLLQLLPHVKPCEVACCVWAATRCGRCLPAGLTAAVQDHVTAAPESYGSRELLQVMLALATSQHQKQHDMQQDMPSKATRGISKSSSSSSAQGAAWFAVCHVRLQQLAPYMTAREVSTALLALARLGSRNAPACSLPAGCQVLPVPLASSLLKRALDTLPSSCPKTHVTLAYALARLELNPGPWWWATWLPYSAAALHVFSPSMLAAVSWSLARLGVQPGGGWMEELLQHTGYKMQGFNAQELTMLLFGLGKWNACPDSWWWAALEESTQHMLGYFTAAELAALLCGMGSTGPPPAPQQQLLAPPPQPVKPSQQQQEQQHGGIWGLAGGPDGDAVTDYVPSGAWSAAMLVSAHKALSGAHAGHLGGIAMGLAKLGIMPSRTWLDAFEAAVMAALPEASLKEIAAVLWGLSVLSVQPSTTLVQAVDDRIMDSLAHSSDHTATAAASAPAAETAAAAPDAAAAQQQLGQWSALLGRSAGGSTAAATAGGAGVSCRPSAAVAAQLLWSVARLPEPQGVAAWADDLLEGVQPALRGASRQTLFVLLRSLAWLRHGPGCRQWMDRWWSAYTAHLPAVRVAQTPPPIRRESPLSAAASSGVNGLGDASSSGRMPPAGFESPSHPGVQEEQDRLPEGQQQQQQSAQLRKLLKFDPAAEQMCLELTVVLWSFKQTCRQPTGQTAWLHTLAAVTQPLLWQVSAGRFSLLLAQMAALRVCPEEGWLAAVEAAAVQHFEHMAAEQVQQTLASMLALGWVPSSSVKHAAALGFAA